jgi:hypothetical protein
MNICLRELPDNRVTIMSNIGQAICTFHSMQEAVHACRQWSHFNDDIILDVLDYPETMPASEQYS